MDGGSLHAGSGIFGWGPTGVKEGRRDERKERKEGTRLVREMTLRAAARGRL